ncbi:hypothetical protein CN378_18950 [Bacillus sp. AFS015802]|uniref:DUF2975 domain-containing protein n=1 Tax=Bacillus sp. AFS015802 TaxID=2033486 RepID=UPI000BF852AA|nr:DUF2975 domain-containing protein [Bacillus sp. AFS015802]PFA63108.1 hypothetical protein CN378_18950 [Bacillus sp. AFS015802]
MKRETLFLKIALFLIGAPIAALCFIGMPMLAMNAAGWSLAYVVYGILAVMYASAIPFFTALFQAYKLLTFIDQHNAFSESSVKALKTIKTCAIVICSFYVAGMPLFYALAEFDDAPGVIVIGMIFIFGSAVIAVFAAVLQKLLNNAIEIKSEHDLTV